MQFLRNGCLAFLAVALLQAQAPAPKPDPYQIFGEARARWNAQQYPAWIAFTIVTRLYSGDASVARHYRAMYDPSRRALHVDVQSAEEVANPYHPHGAVACLTYSFEPCEPDLTIKRETGPDLFGVPLVSPTYSFGLASRGGIPGAPAPVASRIGPPVIAAVRSARQDYKIAFVSQDAYAGGTEYHLRLTPLRRPAINRIREMWVDASSHEVVRLEVQGNFEQDPGAALPWTITFQNIDGAQYVDTELCTCSLRLGGKHFDRASVTFERVEPQSGLPPLTITLPQYARNALTEPDLQ